MVEVCRVEFFKDVLSLAMEVPKVFHLLQGTNQGLAQQSFSVDVLGVIGLLLVLKLALLDLRLEALSFLILRIAFHLILYQENLN